MWQLWKPILILFVVTSVAAYPGQHVLSSKPTRGMATRFDPDEVLNTPDVYTVSIRLAELALEFGVLGHLDTARDLVSLLNKHNPCYHRHHEKLQPLWFAWDITSWPEGEKERVKAPLDESNKETSQSFRLDVLKEDQPSSFQVPQELKEKLQDLSAKKSAGSDLAFILAETLDIASTVGGEDSYSVDREDMRNILEGLLGDIAKQLHSPYQMRYLAEKRNVWQILKIGLLSQAAGIDAEEEKEVGRLAVKTFKQRFENGRPRSPMWNISIEELLRIISENTVMNKGAQGFYFDMDMDTHPTTLLHDPLPAKDISTLEIRLGVSLPQDYKDFLSFSNGLDSAWNGILLDPPLFEAAKINWTEDSYLPADLINIEALGIIEEMWDESWPRIGHVIQIGEEDIDSVWLLPPATVKMLIKAYKDLLKNNDENVQRSVIAAINDFAGSTEEFEKLEWCLITWAAGGCAHMQSYPSFKAFLVEKADDSSTIKF